MINESLLEDYKKYFAMLQEREGDTDDTLDKIHLIVNALDFSTSVSKDIGEDDNEDVKQFAEDVRAFYNRLVSAVDEEVLSSLLSNINYYQNLLRWVIYDVVHAATSNRTSSSVASIMQCSRSKVNQYVRTAKEFDIKDREYMVPVIIYDTAGDTKGSGLQPNDLVNNAIENGLSAKEVKQMIDQHREISHRKLRAQGAGSLVWQGNQILIEPTRVDYDNSSLGTELTNVQVLWNITQVS